MSRRQSTDGVMGERTPLARVRGMQGFGPRHAKHILALRVRRARKSLAKVAIDGGS